MADSEYSGQIDVEISPESLAALSSTITGALTKAQKPALDAMNRLMASMARQQADAFRKAAAQTRSLGDATADYTREASKGDKATLGFVQQVTKLTKAIEVQVAAINSAASANRNASQITQRELISQRVALDRSEQLKLQILRESGKKQAIEAQAAGNLQLVAARQSQQQRVLITRLAVETIGRLEKGLLRLLTGFGRTSVSALSKSFGAIGSLLRRQNSSFTTNLNTSLSTRERLLSRSFSRQEADLRYSVSRQERTIQELNRKISGGVLGVATGRGAGAGLFGGIAAGAGLAGLLGSGFTRFSDLERINKQFLALTGNLADTNMLLDQVREFAKTTPFDLVGVADLAKGFLAIGTAAEDVVPSVKAIADAVAFTGGGTDALQRIQRAIGQIVSIGKLQGDELNQLSENLPGLNIIQALADQLTGGDTAVLMQMKEAGEITSDMFMTAFMTALTTDSRLVGASEDIANTLSGRFANLKESFANLGAALIGLVAGPLRALASGLQTAFQGAADFLRGEGLSAELDLLRTALFGVAAGMAAVVAAKAAVETLGLLAKVSTLIASPFGLIVVLAGLLGGALVALTQRSEPLRAALGELWGRFEEIGSSIAERFGPAIGSVTNLVDDELIPAIDAAASWLADHLVGAFDTAVRFITGTVVPAVRAFADMLVDLVVPAAKEVASVATSAFGFLAEKAKAVFDAVLPYLQPAIEGFRILGAAVAAAFGGDFSGLASGASAAAGGIGATISAIASRIGELLAPLAKRVVDFLSDAFSRENLLRAALGFLDLVEEIGRIIGSIASDPRLFVAIAAIGAAAAVIAVRFLEGFVKGIYANYEAILAPIPGLIAKVLFDPVILLPVLFGVFALSKILPAFRDIFARVGQTSASSFAAGIKSGASGGVDFIRTLFGGSEAALAASSRRLFKSVSREAQSLQNSLRVLGSTTIVDPSNIDEARLELRGLDEMFTPAQQAALRLRDRISAIGQAASAIRGTTVNAFKGIGTVIAGLNSAFLGAFSMDEGRGALGTIRSGLSRIRLAFTEGAAQLKRIAVEQYGTIGKAMGEALSKGATAALVGFGAFIGGKAEGAAGGSGALSAIGAGLTGLAVGGPLVGAAAAGIALIGAEMGRAEAAAKKFRESVEEVANTIVTGMQDAGVAVADLKFALDSVGESKVVDLLGPGLVEDLNKLGVSYAELEAIVAGSGGDVSKAFTDLFSAINGSKTGQAAPSFGVLDADEWKALGDALEVINQGLADANGQAKFLGVTAKPSADAVERFVGMFDGDKVERFNGVLKSSANTFAELTTAREPTAVDSVNTAIDQTIARLSVANAALAALLNPSGDTTLGQVVDTQILAVAGAGSTIQTGLASGTESGAASARQAQRQVSEAVGAALTQAIQDGFTDPTALAFITGGILKSALEGVTDQALIDSLTASFNTAIAGAQPLIDEAAAAANAEEYNAKFKEFLQNNPVLQEVRPEIAQEVFDALGTQTETVGADVIAGIERGIVANKWKAITAAYGVADEIVRVMKVRLQISSPSKVMRDIGDYIGEGLALGLEDSTASVGSLVANAIDDAIARATDAASRGRLVLAELATSLFGAAVGSDATISFGTSGPGVGDALAGITSASGSFVDQFNSTVEAIFAAARKQIEGKDPLTAAESRLIGANPFSLDPANAIGAQNRAGFLQSLDAIAGLGDSLLAIGEPLDQVIGTVKLYRDQLVEQATALGFSGDALGGLIEQLGLSDSALASLAASAGLAAEALAATQAAQAEAAQAASAQDQFSARQIMLQAGIDSLLRGGAGGEQIGAFLASQGISADLVAEVMGASGDALRSVLLRAFGLSTTTFLSSTTGTILASQIGNNASANFDANGNPTSVFGPQSFQQFFEQVVLPVLAPYSVDADVLASLEATGSFSGLMDLLEQLLGVAMPDFLDAVTESVAAVDDYIAELNRAVPVMRQLPENASASASVTDYSKGEDTSKHRYLTINNYISLPSGDPKAAALAVMNRQARAAMVPA